MGMHITLQVLAHQQHMAELTQVSLQISDGAACARIGQIKTQMGVLACRRLRRIEREARRDIRSTLREDQVRRQARTVIGEVAGKVCRHKGCTQELPGTSLGHEVA